jgi:CRP/FNR family transcriptional regulator, anaerobic regulatory protein
MLINEYRDKVKLSAAPIVSLDDHEWETCFRYSEFVKLEKDEHLLKEGQICDFVAFVLKGSLLYYKFSDEGDEKATDFAFEKDWVSNMISRLLVKPASIFIKAIEPTDLHLIRQSVLEELYQKVPKLERWGRMLAERTLLYFVEQSVDLQTLPAKERYANLLKRNPQIIQKVPLYHIANYLGIAPKSLSMIRTEILRQ